MRLSMPVQTHSDSRVGMSVLVLAILCACSAIAVIYSTHLSRVSYMEKSANQRFIDDLDMQWSRLQIEEGTFSEHGRIEAAAREELRMHVPGLQDSILIPLVDRPEEPGGDAAGDRADARPDAHEVAR